MLSWREYVMTDSRIDPAQKPQNKTSCTIVFTSIACSAKYLFLSDGKQLFIYQWYETSNQLVRKLSPEELHIKPHEEIKRIGYSCEMNEVLFLLIQTNEGQMTEQSTTNEQMQNAEDQSKTCIQSEQHKRNTRLQSYNVSAIFILLIILYLISMQDSVFHKKRKTIY